MEFITSHHISDSTVEDRINNGYKFDIGQYISAGWEIFQKEWLNFSLYGLIVGFILFTGIGVFFVYPLLIGFSLGAEKVERGEKLEIGDMFGGFKKNLGDLVILILLPMVVIMILYIPFIILIFAGATSSDPDIAGGIAGGTMLIMYPLIFILGIAMSLILFFAPYMVFYGDYKAMDAIKKSWKIAKKQPLMIIIFIWLLSMLGSLGMLACGIGYFVTLALAYTCYYPAMKDVLFDKTVDNNSFDQSPLV